MKGIVIFVQTAIVLAVAKEHILSTSLGQMKGLIRVSDTETVYQFLKIPYAKPPIGSLRFRKPEPYGPWNGVLDGTKHPPACIQPQYLDIERFSETNEDCLFLNIYVPNGLSVTNNKAVMIWIHGGAFITGSGSAYDGSELAVTGDVIVVTINYRLNIFGFISSGDSNLPGNYGLWDQRLAIEWVKNNIADYGGNPSSITIFGESAGSWSVGFQSISPLNSGLFQRAILQSGSPFSKLASIDSGNLQSFASHASCSGNDSTLIRCLDKQSASDLLNVFVKTNLENKGMKPVVGATVDGEFLPAKPTDLLKDMTSLSSHYFRSLDIIVGTVATEGSLFILYGDALGVNMTQGLTSKLLCDVVSPIMTRDFFDNVSAISEAICDRYSVPSGDTANMAEQGRQLVNMYGDLFFVSPAIELLNIHSKDNLKTNTYQYLFTHDLFRIFPTPDWVQGAQHGSEVIFLFGFKDFAANTTVSTEERYISQNMLKYWSNFAKTGNPNDESPNVPEWKTYEVSKREYIQLDTNMLTKSHLLDERVRFWTTDIPNILNPIIESKSGEIKGTAVQYQQNLVTEFLGIPYAQPPTGNLRFARPMPVKAWPGIFNALSSPPSCIQDIPPPQFYQLLPNRNFSEDCLYLNLYLPGSVSKVRKKAVMIWIHGGGYVSGQASLYDGSVLAATGDVIVVTINYRVGVFGFLSSNDSVLKGNYGLWDQKLAIEWIKNNIAAFGGDASSITIFGESAGGFSVSLHAISPLNKNLFHRVIAQSGTSLINMAVSKSPVNLVFLYSNLLNCTNQSTINMVQCLREKSPEELHSVYPTLVTEYWKLNSYHPAYQDLILKPNVDGELIPDDPLKLLSDPSSASYKFFRSLDVMAGTTNAEGSLLMPTMRMLHVNVSNGIPTEVLCDILSPAFAYGKNQKLTESSQMICDEYKVKDGNTTNLIEQGRQIVNMYGDDLFVSPTILLLNMHSVQNLHGNSYQYLFSKSLPRHLELFSVPTWFDGSSHGSELFYMFSSYHNIVTIFNISWNQEEKDFIDNMLVYWSNFAKTGNPNSKDLPHWPKFKTKEKEYLEFCSDDSIKAKEMLWPNRMKFWFDLKGVKYIMEEPPIGSARIGQPGLVLSVISIVMLLLL